MADEETVLENGEESPEGGQKKGGNKLFLFGGIGLGVVVVGVALAMFVIGPMMSDSPEGEEQSTAQVESEGKSDGGHAKKPEKKKHGGGQGSSASLIYTIENIVVNPAGTGGSRFLSASIGFEVGSAEVISAFEQKDAIIRDALITILSAKTVAQLTDPKQKEIARYQIKKRVSKLMATDELSGVYYTDFVLQ